ncbi:hypothetical protein BK120_33675 [Paenibacillus sp. FSL A5-0031]|nr:hypothetical protein BK120_33675 [Paenibacillus sp. FSL A5-0031]
MFDKDRLDILEKENDHLKNLMIQHLWEITMLKNEIRNVKQDIADRQVGEQEKRLILLAKSIVQTLDPLGEI